MFKPLNMVFIMHRWEISHIELKKFPCTPSSPEFFFFHRK